MMSHTAEYGVRAMVALSAHTENELQGVKEIAATTGIPRNYLSKVMHALVRARFVHSERGPGGGFCLSIPGGKISVYDVVTVFDDLAGEPSCFLGRPECDANQMCPAHDRWTRVWSGYEEFLRNTTIASLTETAPKKISRKKPQRRK